MFVDKTDHHSKLRQERHVAPRGCKERTGGGVSLQT